MTTSPRTVTAEQVLAVSPEALTYDYAADVARMASTPDTWGPRQLMFAMPLWLFEAMVAAKLVPAA